MNSIHEAPQGFQGTTEHGDGIIGIKVTKGKIKREHGNKSCLSDIQLWNREQQNQNVILLGNKGTQGKFCWEQGIGRMAIS